METTVLYLLMPQKCINSKQKYPKQKITQCVKVIFETILQLIIWKKNRIKTKCKIFSVQFNPIDTNDILDIHK